MTNKKAGAYPETLGIGRKLGRHLPRIASGDAEEEEVQAVNVSKRLSEERKPEQNAKTSRLERREQRMREWEKEMIQTSEPVRTKRYSEEIVVPGSLDADVAGVPGRLRLSRENSIQAPNVPVPSSRINRGLWADTQRHLLQAYEYLCHVGEAQQWIEGCLGEELGFGVVEMDEGLRNGVVLAKLVRAFQGETVVRRIYEAAKLDFRHSDNINYFFIFVRHVGLPEVSSGNVPWKIATRY